MPDLLISCCQIAGHTYCVVCPSDQLPRAAAAMLRWAATEGLNFDYMACWMMIIELKEKRDG